MDLYIHYLIRLHGEVLNYLSIGITFLSIDIQELRLSITVLRAALSSTLESDRCPSEQRGKYATYVNTELCLRIRVIII
jgi:hypothetical protein